MPVSGSLWQSIISAMLHASLMLNIDCGIKLLGLGILAIGIWAWSEKDTFNNLSKLTNIALDPAFIFIWAGAITFIIG